MPQVYRPQPFKISMVVATAEKRFPPLVSTHDHVIQNSVSQQPWKLRHAATVAEYLSKGVSRIETQAMAAALDGVSGSPALPPKPLTMASISEPSRTSFSSNFSATL